MATSPDISAIAHITVPKPLRDLPAWLCWKFEPGATPEAKMRKVPYWANGGRRHGQHGSQEDRYQLTSFDAARSAAARRGMSGVGFCPLPEFGITALDFDNCVTDGKVHSDLIPVIASAYTEYSPSGNGIRAFYRGQMGNLKAHGKPYGVECFSTNGFVTVTGNALPEVAVVGTQDTVADMPAEVRELIRARFKHEFERREGPPLERVGLSHAELQECLDGLPSDLSYDQWIMIGMALHHETAGEGFEQWDEWSSRSPKYTTREYGEERWRSFGKNDGDRVTARSLVKLAGEHGVKVQVNKPAAPEEFKGVEESTGAAITPPQGEPTLPAKREKFQPIPYAIFASTPPPEWIVKGLLPKAELAVLFGESGSGKSFMALDVAMSIARGEPWRGLRTRAGRVVYIAAEGAGGFRNRLEAYRQHYNLNGQQPFDVIPDAPNLLLKDDALSVAKAIGPASVVVVDTFAQVTPGGNENAGEDVGRALAHCKGIHVATGGLVLLIHHAGKDASKGARGWSGLRAAADAELEVIRNTAGRCMRTSKQKDGDDTGSWGFGLQVVNIGMDSDGDIISSCVVTETPVPVAQPVTNDIADYSDQFAQLILDSPTGSIQVSEIADRLAPLATAKEKARIARAYSTYLRSLGLS